MNFVSNNYIGTGLYNLFVFESHYLDISDKLNWQYTINFLIAMTFVISSAISSVNKTINCASPINFTPNQEAYTNLACYVSEKYYIPDDRSVILLYNNSLIYKMELNNYESTLDEKEFNKQFEPIIIDSDNNIITHSILATHYIWVEFLLMASACSFWLVKHLWWFMLKRSTHIDLCELLSAAKKFKQVKNVSTYKDKYIHSYILSSLKKFLVLCKFNEMKAFSSPKKLCYFYMFIKILNLVNILVNILFINYIIELKFSFKLWQEQIVNSNYFPYKSICILKVKELTTVHVYAILCNLPVNFFIQYILGVLLVWYSISAVLNFYSILKWLYEFKSNCKYEYTMKYTVSVCSHEFDTDQPGHLNTFLVCKLCNRSLKHFALNFLSSDVLFLIRNIELFSHHHSEKLLVDIFSFLWKFYVKKSKNI